MDSAAEALERRYLRAAGQVQPWVARGASEQAEQQAFQDILRRHAGARLLGAGCFVSPDAHVFTAHLELGDHSWIAAGAILRGHVTIGAHCSVNPYAHIAGKVRIGDGVRIAGGAAIYGFNHGIAATDVPIHRQAITVAGIEIGDDTWIGANAVIVDGVSIGAHCVVAGGAVVTRDLPAWCIAAGNPGRVVRDRRAHAAAE